MGLIMKSGIPYGGGNGGQGSGVPNGGTTGQALVKKSDTNGDVEWANIEGNPSGWGIAKSGVIQVPITNQRGDIVIPVNDLGLASGKDYNVALTIVGGGTGSWGEALTFLWGKSSTQANGSVMTTGADVDRVDISYIIVAKGYGRNVSGWGVAKVGYTGVDFDNSEWSGTSTVDISDLSLNSNTDYEVFVEPASGGTVGAWSNSTAYVGSKSKDNFTVGAVKSEVVTGRLNIKYVIFAKGFGGGGGGGGGATYIAGTGIDSAKLENGAIAVDSTIPNKDYVNARQVPAGGQSGYILTKNSNADRDVTWTSNIAQNLMREEYPYGTITQNITVPQLACERTVEGGKYTFKIPKTSKLTSWNDLWLYLGGKWRLEVYGSGFSSRVVISSYLGDSISSDRMVVAVDPPVNGDDRIRFTRYQETSEYIKVQCLLYQDSSGIWSRDITQINLIGGSNGEDLGIATEYYDKNVHNLTGVVLEDLKNSSFIPNSLSDTIVYDFTQPISIGKIRRPDGSVTTIWRKCLYVGQMPNNTTLTYSHGITGNFRILNIGGYQYNSVSNSHSNFCYAGNMSASNIADGTKVWISGDTMSIKTLVDRRQYEGWAFIDYFMMTG